MDSNISYQEFNEKNSIYYVIYNYIVRTQCEFMDKKINDLSKNNVKKIIEEEDVIFNSIYIHNPTTKVSDGDQIEIPIYKINFVCRKNLKYQDVEEIKVLDEIDYYINQFLINSLGTSNLNEITADKMKFAFATIINLFQDKGFEQIKTSELSYELTDYIKSKLNDTNIAKELDIPKKQFNFGGKLVALLINGKAEKENSLRLINDNLLNGNYDHSLFKYLQDLKKLFATDSFQYLINPLLNHNVSSQIALDNLLKPVNKSYTFEGIEEKFIHYENSKPIFISYFELLNKSDTYSQTFFHDVAEYLFKLLKVNCNTAIERAAEIKVDSTNRKYNFSNPERLQQEVFLIVSNTGEGLAKNVSLASSSDFFEFEPINVGILKPNEKREVSVIVSIKYNSDFEPQLAITYSWEELSGKQSSSKGIVVFLIQKAEIPWEDLKRQNPYSNSIIENAEKLYGRDEILDELKSNILSDNIESYKLWGQKRVGKSSIVKTLKTILDKEEKVIIVYRSLGGLKNTDPVITLNNLGESLCSEVYEELDKKIKDNSIRDSLRGIQIPTFNGSLFPLENYIKQLRRIDNSLRFIFIMDEFDRINEEFFLPGNLGETLSLGIGKGLNENRYIGFILVGSENMHLLDRQGINYNSYQEKEVDTFRKQSEYKSFVQIVKGPVSPHINYLDEAIEKIYYSSNGNPYFANLICANIFKNAYRYKDNEIDAHSVNEVISTIINSSQKSHFEHYWSDGITEESNIKKERKADIRRRILVSFSMASNPSENKLPNKIELARNFKRPLETEYKIEKYEVENTISEFINRKIFVESDFNQIRILPHLFESWLCGIGKSLMIEGVSDLMALQREIDLEKELALKPDELNRLSENFHFKGGKRTVDKLSKYFNQFGGATEQRRVFKLLDSIYYISNDELFEFFRKESKNIFPKTEFFLKERTKTIYRDKVELYTFSRFHSENISVVESFKLMNHIRPQKILRSIKEDSQTWKKNDYEEILIIEPIIESFADIQEELFMLLNDEIKKSNISIRIITFIITAKAKSELITATSTFTNLKLIAFKEVEETKIKPFINGTEIFENSDEANQAYYEVRKLFPNTSKDVLLVLFENLCPSKSCPVLWSQSAQFNPIFYNEYGKLELINESDEGEKRRDKLYYIAKELSQKINRFIISYLKNKAKNEGELDWFILKYIPRRTLDNVNKKWLDEGQTDPKESYFDFIDYKEIIKNIKDSNFQKKFMIGDKEQLEWMNKCNELRRDPAHPEKPCPLVEEVDYFEKIKNLILPKLS